MPSTSKSQQRLFGWALSCKKGETDNCPANVKKLAASMSEAELEKYASTSHDELPEVVKESLVDCIAEMNMTEIAILESVEEEIEKLWKELKIDAAWELGNPENGIRVKKSEDARLLAKELNTRKIGCSRGKCFVGSPIGASDTSLVTVYDLSESKKDEPPVSNDVKTPPPVVQTPPPPPGYVKADTRKDPGFFTPSLFKRPGDKKAKSEQRIMDFKEFLKRINYETHDGILQKGHGSNLTGN